MRKIYNAHLARKADKLKVVCLHPAFRLGYLTTYDGVPPLTLDEIRRAVLSQPGADTVDGPLRCLIDDDDVLQHFAAGQELYHYHGYRLEAGEDWEPWGIPDSLSKWCEALVEDGSRDKRTT